MSKANDTTSKSDQPDFSIPSEDKMVLFVGKAAPNPRRVLLFCAELGIDDKLELRFLDMRQGHHKLPEYLALNPCGQIPALLLPDGNAISESVAICRFLEQKFGIPSKDSLFGETALECANIEQWQRRIEIQLLVSGVGRVWINNPLLFRFARKSGIKQRDSQRDMGQRIGTRILKVVETELAKHGESFICGSKPSIADITLLCTLDFGVGLAGYAFEKEKFPKLSAWWDMMSARDSVKKYPSPYSAEVFAKMRKASNALGVVRKLTLGLL